MREDDMVVTLRERLAEALVDAERARLRGIEAATYHSWRSFLLGILTGVAMAVIVASIGVMVAVT